MYGYGLNKSASLVKPGWLVACKIDVTIFNDAGPPHGNI